MPEWIDIDVSIDNQSHAYRMGFDDGFKAGKVAGSQGAKVYQGVNTLCAHCGQPTHDAVDTGIFVYCSIACRDAR